MTQFYRKRQDIIDTVFLPDGASLTDPNRLLSGARFAKFCPEFLEMVPNEDPSKLITEDLPNTTPTPATEDTIMEQKSAIEDTRMLLTEDEPEPVVSTILVEEAPKVKIGSVKNAKSGKSK